jgi:hypothetical protein
MVRKKTALFVSIAVAAAAAGVYFGMREWKTHWSIIQGAVIRRDSDARKEEPLAGVSITASHGNTKVVTKSDASGYFRISFPDTVLPGERVTLVFRDADYGPLDLTIPIQFRSSLRRLVVAELTPLAAPAAAGNGRPPSVVSNLKVRYTTNSTTAQNIGSAVKTFQVENRGNVPCHRQEPCSPDGYWKASTNSVTLDAGSGNEFQDARASCIAGPCPFTRIDSSGFANGGRVIVVSATDWSDTATFLLQAEVFHTSIVSKVRESYPVVFGSTFNFTIPPNAEGVSLEAELDGVPIVFPLGPDVFLAWANCSTRTETSMQKSTTYQCELKPGFHF